MWSSSCWKPTCTRSAPGNYGRRALTPPPGQHGGGQGRDTDETGRGGVACVGAWAASGVWGVGRRECRTRVLRRAVTAAGCGTTLAQWQPVSGVALPTTH